MNSVLNNPKRFVMSNTAAQLLYGPVLVDITYILHTYIYCTAKCQKPNHNHHKYQLPKSISSSLLIISDRKFFRSFECHIFCSIFLLEWCSVPSTPQCSASLALLWRCVDVEAGSREWLNRSTAYRHTASPPHFTARLSWILIYWEREAAVSWKCIIVEKYFIIQKKRFSIVSILCDVLIFCYSPTAEVARQTWLWAPAALHQYKPLQQRSHDGDCTPGRPGRGCPVMQQYTTAHPARFRKYFSGLCPQTKDIIKFYCEFGVILPKVFGHELKILCTHKFLSGNKMRTIPLADAVSVFIIHKSRQLAFERTGPRRSAKSKPLTVCF